MENSVVVKFTNGLVGKYTFTGEQKKWEKYFIDIWTASGHEVTVTSKRRKKS